MKKPIFTVLFMVIMTVVFTTVLAVMNHISQPKIQMNREMMELKSMMYTFGLLPEDILESELPSNLDTGDLPWDEGTIMVIREKQLRNVMIPVPDSIRNLLADSYLMIEDSIEIVMRTEPSGQIHSYGFLMKGMGLWGSISAFAAVSSDLKSMIGIDFLEQVETPGLGARITEQEFKYFFRNLDLGCFENAQPGQLCVEMVRKKDRSNIMQRTHELHGGESQRLLR